MIFFLGGGGRSLLILKVNDVVIDEQPLKYRNNSKIVGGGSENGDWSKDNGF